MSDEYTPTTDALRDLWVDHLLDPLPRSEGIERVPAVQAEFDRWLRDIKAQAWYEGYAQGDVGGYFGDTTKYKVNPYREED